MGLKWNLNNDALDKKVSVRSLSYNYDVHQNGRISALPAVYKRFKISKRSQSASAGWNESELFIYQTQLESFPFEVRFPKLPYFRNYPTLP